MSTLAAELVTGRIAASKLIPRSAWQLERPIYTGEYIMARQELHSISLLGEYYAQYLMRMTTISDTGSGAHREDLERNRPVHFILKASAMPRCRGWSAHGRRPVPGGVMTAQGAPYADPTSMMRQLSLYRNGPDRSGRMSQLFSSTRT